MFKNCNWLIKFTLVKHVINVPHKKNRYKIHKKHIKHNKNIPKPINKNNSSNPSQKTIETHTRCNIRKCILTRLANDAPKIGSTAPIRPLLRKTAAICRTCAPKTATECSCTRKTHTRNSRTDKKGSPAGKLVRNWKTHPTGPEDSGRWLQWLKPKRGNGRDDSVAKSSGEYELLLRLGVVDSIYVRLCMHFVSNLFWIYDGKASKLSVDRVRYLQAFTLCWDFRNIEVSKIAKPRASVPTIWATNWWQYVCIRCIGNLLLELLNSPVPTGRTIYICIYFYYYIIWT